MQHEFLDGGQLLWDFADRVEVLCPKCQGAGVVIRGQSPGGARFACGHCAFVVGEKKAWFQPWHAHFRGRCGGCGKTKDLEIRRDGGELPEDCAFTCDACGDQGRAKRTSWRTEKGIHDPWFGMELRLKTLVGSQVLWAYNLAHLDFLEDFVSAKHRKRQSGRNGSLASRLPQWLKQAQHRDAVLKGIAKIRELVL